MSDDNMEEHMCKRSVPLFKALGRGHDEPVRSAAGHSMKSPLNNREQIRPLTGYVEVVS